MLPRRNPDWQQLMCSHRSFWKNQKYRLQESSGTGQLGAGAWSPWTLALSLCIQLISPVPSLCGKV